MDFKQIYDDYLHGKEKEGVNFLIQGVGWAGRGMGASLSLTFSGLPPV